MNKKKDKERRLAEEKRLAEARQSLSRAASPDAAQDRDVAPEVVVPVDPTPAGAQEVDPTVGWLYPMICRTYVWTALSILQFELFGGILKSRTVLLPNIIQFKYG